MPFLAVTCRGTRLFDLLGGGEIEERDESIDPNLSEREINTV